jgi:hypothetical protein
MDDNKGASSLLVFGGLGLAVLMILVALFAS